MPPLKTKAIILRRTNYGEADRILQILTPDHGKLGVIAKSVRKAGSKRAGAIEFFSEIEIVVTRGKGNLGILTSTRLLHFHNHILEDYDRLQFGYEIIKRVNRLAENVHEASPYYLLEGALRALDDLAIDLRIVMAWFYLQTAELTGHGLNLSRDAANKPLDAGFRYHFDIAEMSFAPQPTGNFTADHLKLLKIMKLKEPHTIANISSIEPYLDDCLSLAHAVAE